MTKECIYTIKKYYKKFWLRELTELHLLPIKKLKNNFFCFDMRQVFHLPTKMFNKDQKSMTR